MTLKEMARQAADAEYRAWQRQEARTTEDTPLVDRVADAVTVAVLEHAIAFVKARADVENSVVAPGMWLAAGYMRHHLLAECAPAAPPETPQMYANKILVPSTRYPVE